MCIIQVSCALSIRLISKITNNPSLCSSQLLHLQQSRNNYRYSIYLDPSKQSTRQLCISQDWRALGNPVTMACPIIRQTYFLLLTYYEPSRADFDFVYNSRGVDSVPAEIQTRMIVEKMLSQTVDFPQDGSVAAPFTDFIEFITAFRSAEVRSIVGCMRACRQGSDDWLSTKRSIVRILIVPCLLISLAWLFSFVPWDVLFMLYTIETRYIPRLSNVLCDSLKYVVCSSGHVQNKTCARLLIFVSF